jgi:hypothetical protein
VDRYQARDALLLAYAVAELTLIAALLSAFAAGLPWVGLAAAFLLGVTVSRRRRALARIGRPR